MRHVRGLLKTIAYPLLYLFVSFVVTIPFMVLSAFPVIEELSAGGTLDIAELTRKIAESFDVGLITIISAVVTFLIMLLVLHKEWRHRSFWGISRIYKPGVNILLTVILALVFQVFLETFFLYTGLSDKFAETSELLEGLLTGGNPVFMIIGVGLCAPFIEELLLRGMAFDRARKWLNLPAALIIQAFLFALMHGNLFQGSYALFLGVLLCLIMLWSNSIWIPIIFHIVFNSTSSVLSLMAPSDVQLNGTLGTILLIASGLFTIACIVALYLNRDPNKYHFADTSEIKFKPDLMH